jgi:hypothetical protein
MTTDGLHHEPLKSCWLYAYMRARITGCPVTIGKTQVLNASLVKWRKLGFVNSLRKAFKSSNSSMATSKI